MPYHNLWLTGGKENQELHASCRGNKSGLPKQYENKPKWWRNELRQIIRGHCTNASKAYSIAVRSVDKIGLSNLPFPKL